MTPLRFPPRAPRNPVPPVRYGLPLLGVLLLLIVAGCSGDSVVGPKLKAGEWTSLHLESDAFKQVLLHDNSLYVVDTPRGVFVQERAFSGAWKPLGPQLGFPEPHAGGANDGVCSIAIAGGEIFAGITQPRDTHFAHIYRRKLGGEATWAPSDSGMPDSLNLHSIGLSDSGVLLVATWSGLFNSSDAGRSWVRQEIGEAGYPTQLDFYSGPAGFFAAGWSYYPNGPGYRASPLLYQSADGGLTWIFITPYHYITSLASGSGADPTIYITTTGYGGYDLRRGKSFDNMSSILHFRGYGDVHVNPSNPNEVVLAAADSLYYSIDSGDHWTGYAPPGGNFLGRAAVDWERKYVAVWDWNAATTLATIYAFALPELTAR